MNLIDRAADTKAIRKLDRRIFWRRSKVAEVSSGRVVGLTWREGEDLSMEQFRRFVKDADKLRVPNSAKVKFKLPDFLDEGSMYELIVKG